MERINSSSTFFHKRAWPALWFGMLTLVAVDGFRGDAAPADLAFVAGLALFGLGLMIALLFDLADEVWDHGDYLVVRRGRAKQQVFLADITAVDHARFVNPRRITLRLRRAGKIGREIAFIPADSLGIFAKSSIARDLSVRVQAARSAARVT